MEGRGKRRAPFQFRRSNLRERGDGVSLCQRLSAEDQRGFTRVEAEVEVPGAARSSMSSSPRSRSPLAEVPVPIWLVVILAVGRDMNGRNSVVRPPDETARRRRLGSESNAPFSRCSEW